MLVAYKMSSKNYLSQLISNLRNWEEITENHVARLRELVTNYLKEI